MIQFDDHILQMGWFNHHLANCFKLFWFGFSWCLSFVLLLVCVCLLVVFFILNGRDLLCFLFWGVGVALFLVAVAVKFMTGKIVDYVDWLIYHP